LDNRMSNMLASLVWWDGKDPEVSRNLLQTGKS
jgi:hypothetical protein